MPTHTLQKVPILVIEMTANTSDVSTGSSAAATMNPVSRRDTVLRNSRSTARKSRNANTPNAGKAIGIPPHVRSRSTDEYGLISTA